MYNAPARSVAVWFATLADANLDQLGWLDDRERGRYERFVGDADRARFLVGAALLRAAVASLTGEPPARLVLDRNCAGCGRWHGPPRVVGSTIAGSVAHSGVVIAVAVARGGRVGIDVERPRSASTDVARWVRREARWKAGGGALRYRELPVALPGYVAGVAASASAGTLDVLPRAGAELLRGG